MILHPRQTLREVAGGPLWLGVLLVTAVLGAVPGALLMRTAIGQQVLVDQWERTSVAFGRSVNDAQYARLEALSAADGPAYAVGSALMSGPGLTLVAAGLLFLAYGRGRFRFRQVFAVATHAGVILALRQVVAAPLAYARETTASATSIGVWFPTFDEASVPARFFASLDLFVIWWLVVLAIGMAVLTDRPARKYAGVCLGAYAALAAGLALAMALTGGVS
ncbi:MAG TPA: YIP1 family protein [Vicinamibacterales bacterium]|nr:YIP1 family protein [Vicinamibacterales bacterium]